MEGKVVKDSIRVSEIAGKKIGFLDIEEGPVGRFGNGIWGILDDEEEEENGEEEQ